ncbi:hypothetical protein Tco_0992539 [Tanacetum coccineum]|uniref:Uncharacterized protein n=1 Tax=Tanacetum coccineum TaxID=301880 RepID=A0ABQ5F2Q9_9ASTR
MGFHGIANMAIDPCGVWGDVEVIVLLSSCRGAGGVRVWEIGNNGPSTRIYILHVKSLWCEKIKGLADLPPHGYMVFCKDGPCDGIMGLTAIKEEIDIFPGLDDSIPPGIESDDDVVEDIPVDVPNILPTHPTLLIDFDFIPSHNDLGSDLDGSSPSGDRNKIYDLGICIEVESMRFLATLSPVIDTLFPFSSENKDKVYNHGVLASKEKSPPSSSHRGFKASKPFHHKSPMLIHGANNPNLGVRHPDFYPH